MIPIFFYWVLQLPFLTCVRYVCLSLLLANIFMLVISSHVEKIIWNTVCGFFLNLHWLKRLVYKLPYKSINMPPVFFHFITLPYGQPKQSKWCLFYLHFELYTFTLIYTKTQWYSQTDQDYAKKITFFILFCIPASSINRTLQILANSFFMS